MEQVFIDLAKRMEKLSDEMQVVRDGLEVAMKELGVGKMVQDPETMAVYKVIEPMGTFTYFRKIDYKRTALEGEKGGTVLAKKEATEAGFVLSK